MIYAIRHGKDDERYIGGWSNVRLTQKGIIDVKYASLWIRDNLNISNILASDIKRTKETAEIINKVIKVPLKYSEILREQNKGLLNGLPIDIAKKTYHNLKMLAMLDDNTLLVTHRGVINMIYYIFNNQELDMDKSQFGVTYNSIHEIDFKNRLIRKVR